MILQSPHQLASPARRIISLVPSQTSLLHYLGLDIETIGITKFCIHPGNWRKEKKVVGGTKNLRMADIKNLNPDLIIANKEENVKEQIEELAQDFNVWVTDVNNLEEALEMIADIGTLTGTSAAAEDLIYKIEKLQITLFTSQAPKQIKTIAYFIWKDPWMVAASGTYIDELLKLAGFTNYFASQERYPVIELNNLKAQDIDCVFLSSEPYPFKETHVKALQIVFPETNIQLVDGEMFSWYGDHLLKSLPYIHSVKEKLVNP